MIAKETKAHIQLFSTKKTNPLTGIASTNAVKNDNWRGEMFFVENIISCRGEMSADACRQNTKVKG